MHDLRCHFLARLLPEPDPFTQLERFLGWELAALYVAAGLLVAWVGGVIMQAFRPERWVEDYVWKIRMGEAALPAPDRSFAGRHGYAVSEVREIVGRIWKWVLIGIGVGFIWAFGCGMALFLGIKYTVGLRVTAEEEEVGLDIEEHGNE